MMNLDVPAHQKSCCSNSNKFASCFSKMCYPFRCSQQELNKNIKNNFFTLGNCFSGLSSLIGVKEKTCLAVCLKKIKL
jgi:hypothetical protein